MVGEIPVVVSGTMRQRFHGSILDTNIVDFARIQIETLEEIRKAYTNKKLPAFGGIRRYKNIPQQTAYIFKH